jgi:hypothetical protein
MTRSQTRGAARRNRELRNDGIVIQTAPGTTTRMLVSDVGRVEVSAGRVHRPWMGALAFGGIGAGLGLIRKEYAGDTQERAAARQRALDCQVQTPNSSLCDYLEAQHLRLSPAGAAIGAAIGAAVGGIVGAIVRVERWRPSTVNAVITGAPRLVAAPRGRGIGFAIAF